MNKVNYITKDKKKALIEEVEYLKNIRRKEICEALKAAKELGDLSENAEYHQAREDQGKTEDRINKIEYMIKSAIVAKKCSGNFVEIGATVKVKKEGSKNIFTYKIVGDEEADVSENKISHKSPIGEALFGKAKKDIVPILTPRGVVKYTIIDIV